MYTFPTGLIYESHRIVGVWTKCCLQFDSEHQKNTVSIVSILVGERVDDIPEKGVDYLVMSHNSHTAVG